MDAQADRWPGLQEYQAAIVEAESDFKDELRDFCVERIQGLGVPFARPGNFGVVYKVKGKDAAYALKVFSVPQLERRSRYKLIDEYLRSIPMPRQLVSFAYHEKGIRVGGRDYPTLRMEWANGDALDIYLDEQFGSTAPIDNAMFCAEWVATVQELKLSGMAHGDLQHGNILVQPDKTFRLVDYDGMFVPGMAGLTACEAGLSAYQHPERNEKTSRFDESIDDFSALVILLTLACVDADLWERYHEEGRLLLSEEDIAKPGESALLTELAGRKGQVSTLAIMVRSAAEQDIDQVPAFGRVVRELGMEWRGGPEQEAGAGSAGDRRVPAGLPQLTHTQRQVAGLRDAGKTVEEIASALGLFPATVQEYVRLLGHEPEREAAATPAAAVSTRPPPAPPTARPARPQRALSPRQQQVLDLLRAGAGPEQIATRLNLQLSTVNRHLSSIRAAVGDAEVRKLLNQAAAKPTAPPVSTAAAGTPRAVSTRPAKPPQTTPKPAGTRPQPARSVTPSPPATPSYRITPAPKRNTGRTVGRTAGAVLGFIVLLFILLIILGAVLSLTGH